MVRWQEEGGWEGGARGGGREEGSEREGTRGERRDMTLAKGRGGEEREDKERERERKKEEILTNSTKVISSQTVVFFEIAIFNCGEWNI